MMGAWIGQIIIFFILLAMIYGVYYAIRLTISIVKKYKDDI
ncbi:hypothetical protein [Lysinibacillus sp. NPDC093688]